METTKTKLQGGLTTPNEKLLNPPSGIGVLVLLILVTIGSFVGSIFFGVKLDNDGGALWGWLLALSIIVLIISSVLYGGFKSVQPNEAAVLTLFGKYYGTINRAGFFLVNPFTSMVNPTVVAVGGNKKVTLKATTLDNEKQKINDEQGNPIEIGVVVIWKVANATKAVFEVDNYFKYVSTQCDAALRNIVRKYPYDAPEEAISLRGDSETIAAEIKHELQGRVDFAGIEILDTRISNLSYAQEIAAAMLQKQQADAVIAAREKIVNGAVGMVEMALKKLSEKGVVELDEERKAQMVSNLLVVLCANKEVQPIVNSGSIY
ncbi:MAG: SPFH domain-containing protein [Oscillospiraceae bacterium]|jgi:regulator of protease activity HflC (stomatin/prohibitin superfamily)|nr:SPFH domain-containing protein [Oscillospiraceae bacterium]